LNSYFLQGAYKSDKTLLKALLFGGHEITYQAWYGIDLQTLQTNRTYNPSGRYTDESGTIKFYDNEVDNYGQNHAQFLWNERLNTAWNTNVALHFTRGRGYFEQFREDDDFATYGLQPITLNGKEVNTTDLIRRRWLDNRFYGVVWSANYHKEIVDLVLGGGYNRYEGDHFGEIIWAKVASNGTYKGRYYQDASTKNDLNVFAKANYIVNDQLNLFGDLQLRKIGYRANGVETGEVDDTFDFFNPKAGITYDLNRNNHFYFSYAMAHREPNRNDYESGSPKPETLNDLELGWRYVSQSVQMSTNVYYMGYIDQLVLTGELNDVGAPLRANVGRSFRAGLEIDANVMVSKKVVIRPNVALSLNRNKDFVFQRDGMLINLGSTHISFSPELIFGNVLTYSPIANLQVSALTKYVGRQYMGNIDAKESLLKAYSQTDLNMQYTIGTNGIFKSITLSGLLNNVFDAKYVSNGYFYTYDDDFTNPGSIITIEGAGYYPQAGINFLLGATFDF
jgi:iron complex outermembrane receptor protein